MFGEKARRIKQLEEDVSNLRRIRDDALREIKELDNAIEMFKVLAVGSKQFPTYRGIREPRDNNAETKLIRSCVVALTSLGYLEIKQGKFVRPEFSDAPFVDGPEVAHTTDCC